MPPFARDRYERVAARDRAEWRAWLTAHHQDAPGAWLIFSKKGSGIPSVSLIEAIEEALCFGWVDSVMRGLDERRYMLTFTPRKARSPWSPGNRERAERLIAQGLMAPAGLAAVEAARADGRWDAASATIDAGERAVPDDLRAALAANPEAETHFATYTAATRRQILAWIEGAKRPETRQRRIAQTVAAASRRRNPLAARPQSEG